MVMKDMVKIIHYCWFGGNPKSAVIEKCISSWRKFFPNWEIREWNEDNFDVSCNIYVQEAYQAKSGHLYLIMLDFGR